MEKHVTSGAPGLSEEVSAWTNEMQHEFAIMIGQYATARDDLLKCRSVFDIVKVEQDLIAARSKAYFDASVRMAELFGAAARRVTKEASAIAPAAPPSTETGAGRSRS